MPDNENPGSAYSVVVRREVTVTTEVVDNFAVPGDQNTFVFPQLPPEHWAQMNGVETPVERYIPEKAFLPEDLDHAGPEYVVWRREFRMDPDSDWMFGGHGGLHLVFPLNPTWGLYVQQGGPSVAQMPEPGGTPPGPNMFWMTWSDWETIVGCKQEGSVLSTPEGSHFVIRADYQSVSPEETLFRAVVTEMLM